MEIGSQIVENIITRRLSKKDEESILLNVNFPNCDSSKIESIESTFIGPRLFSEGIEKVNRGRRDFYWLKSKSAIHTAEHEKGTDVWAITNQKVSITLVDPYFPVNKNQVIVDNMIDSISE